MFNKYDCLLYYLISFQIYTSTCSKIHLKIQVNGSFTRTIFIYQFNPICPVSRNSGPFWEPGVFGIFINISIFFKLFLEKAKLNRALLEIASVLTTFSTTNYLILFLLLTFYFAMSSKHIIRLIYLVGSITLFMVIVLNTDFLYNKISTQIEQAKVEKLILNEGSICFYNP